VGDALRLDKARTAFWANLLTVVAFKIEPSAAFWPSLVAVIVLETEGLGASRAVRAIAAVLATMPRAAFCVTFCSLTDRTAAPEAPPAANRTVPADLTMIPIAGSELTRII
jgi:hypothetical protein